MTPLDLLGTDIRSRHVAEFLEMRGVNTIDVEVIEDRVFVEATEQGISIGANLDYRINTLHFYAAGVQNSHGYAGELPMGVIFGQPRCTILSLFGGSQKSGGGCVNAEGKTASKWDRYDVPGYSVHLQFSSVTDNLELLTVMSPDAVP